MINKMLVLEVHYLKPVDNPDFTGVKVFYQKERSVICYSCFSPTAIHISLFLDEDLNILRVSTL